MQVPGLQSDIILSAAPRPGAIVAAIMRHWRSARDGGLSAQHGLHAFLYPHGADMLAPVFDSILTLYEAALGRPLVTGAGAEFAPDEAMLCGMLDGSRPRHSCFDCPAGPARTLDCAICSTRIMMALVVNAPARDGPAGC